MVTKEERTSIPLSIYTRNRLREIGKKSETWDQLLNRLIDVYYSAGGGG